MQRGLSSRCLKVGEEVKRALALIFQEIGTLDPRLETAMVTVTEVQMSTDVKTAKVFLLPLGGLKGQQVLSYLKDIKPLIRKELSRKVYLKNTPELIFVLDHSFAEGDQISKILQTTSVQQDLRKADDDNS